MTMYMYIDTDYKLFSSIIKGIWRHSVLGAEGILYRVMKLKNPIDSKGNESGMYVLENFQF